MRTRSKIFAAIVLTAVSSASIFSGLSYFEARQSLRATALAELSDIRDAKAVKIEAYFEDKTRTINSLGANGQIAAAVTDFQTAFENINQGGEDVSADTSSRVREYYERRVLKDLSKGRSGQAVKFETYGPKNRAARQLQFDYIVEPKPAVNPRAKTYAEAHNDHHTVLSAIASANGFDDLYLIDQFTGSVVYSAGKKIDLGANLFTGAFEETALGQVIARVKRDPTGHFSDIDLYGPAGHQASLFFGAPIYSGGYQIGILAARMNTARIDVLSPESDSTGRGFYLAGGDTKLRTNPVLAAENIHAYARLMKDRGLDADTADAIKASKSAIRTQSADIAALGTALRGQPSAGRGESPLGTSVFAASMPLKLSDNDWILVAEREVADVFSPLAPYTRKLGIAAGIFLPFLFLFALWIAGRMMQPLRAMRATADKIASGDAALFGEGKSEWGALGRDLNNVLNVDPWKINPPKLPKRPAHKPIRLMPLDIETTDEPGMVTASVVNITTAKTPLTIVKNEDPEKKNADKDKTAKKEERSKTEPVKKKPVQNVKKASTPELKVKVKPSRKEAAQPNPKPKPATKASKVDTTAPKPAAAKPVPPKPAPKSLPPLSEAPSRLRRRKRR